jgi:glycosyltransferase involved in cell wall biosynthesis
VYNAELHINKTLKSVLSSSYNSFELVIIDDGSTDNSMNIINRYDDNRIKIYDKINSGLIETLNYGINKCSNEIIMRMDADDIISNVKIERQLYKFQKDKPILLGTEGYIIDDNDKIKGEIKLPLNHEDIITSMMKFESSLIHPSIMTYKSVLKKIDFYSSKIKHAEDYDLFLRLSKLGEISNLNEKLIYIRKNENNISHKHAREQIENTFISKKYFQSDDYKPISNSFYNKIKAEVLKSSTNNFYFKLHTQIVKEMYLNKSKNHLYLFILKILRRLIKFVI